MHYKINTLKAYKTYASEKKTFIPTSYVPKTRLLVSKQFWKLIPKGLQSLEFFIDLFLDTQINWSILKLRNFNLHSNQVQISVRK